MTDAPGDPLPGHPLPGLCARGLGLHVPADDAGPGGTGERAPRWLLRGLDLTLHSTPGGRADQIALTGPSGCGKSSLLHLLGGLVTPHEGTVHWDGEPVSRWPTARREAWRRAQVGLVFQQFHLFAELSALDNALLPWQFDRLRVPAAARAEARDLLARLGVAEGTRCGRLSRGEQQRVALVRALARSPRLLLADEPTASLDRDHALAACALLQTLCAEQGSALLLATHDPAIAARFERRLTLGGAPAPAAAEAGP